MHLILLAIVLQVASAGQKEIRCDNCKRMNYSHNTFCVNCGNKLRNYLIYCYSCKNLNSPWNKYCYRCGHYVTPPGETPVKKWMPASANQQSCASDHKRTSGRTFNAEPSTSRSYRTVNRSSERTQERTQNRSQGRSQERTQERTQEHTQERNRESQFHRARRGRREEAPGSARKYPEPRPSTSSNWGSISPSPSPPPPPPPPPQPEPMNTTISHLEIPPPPSPVETEQSTNTDNKVVEEATTEEGLSSTISPPTNQSKDENKNDSDDEISFLSSKKTFLSSDSDDILS